MYDIKKTKILFFDIESMSNLGYIWGKYEQNVIEYEREFYMLCFAYKWLGQSKVSAYSLPDFKNYRKDKYNDKDLVTKLWELFNEADIVVAHNGDSFDIRMANARFAFHGLPPPSPYKTVDTKKVAKRYFRFNSNKLDDLGNYFGLGRKIDTGGFELWLGCVNNDPMSWYKMVKYNKQDIVLLEKIYNKLLPWIVNHPNRNLYESTTCNCPNCGSSNMIRHKTRISRTGMRQQWQCKDCGAYATGSTIKIDKVLS